MNKITPMNDQQLQPPTTNTNQPTTNNQTHQNLTTATKIYEAKCRSYVDWLQEARPSFTPPRYDLRMPDEDPGAGEVYSERLDVLNNKFEKLLEMLSLRLRTAMELNGYSELVSGCGIEWVTQMYSRLATNKRRRQLSFGYGMGDEQYSEHRAEILIA